MAFACLGSVKCAMHRRWQTEVRFVGAGARAGDLGTLGVVRKLLSSVAECVNLIDAMMKTGIYIVWT